MIRTLKTLVLILALAPMAAFAGTKVDVKVEGMTCGSCVKKVNDELAKLTDVEPGSVAVMLEGNHATLTLKTGDKKSMAAVEAAVKKAGYKVAKIDVVPDAAAKKVN